MGPIVLSCLLAVLAVGPSPDADALATELLEAGAAYFDAKDTAAMVGSYTEDAEVTLISKVESGIEEHPYRGHDSIRKLYADLFSKAGTIRSKNVVEYARLIGPDLLLIAGTFEPNLSEPMALQFVQLRLRQADGKWLIRDLRVVPIPR